MTGDLNVPSHLDWTREAAEASDEEFRDEIAWPVSTRLEELGFRDTFRETHPDEVEFPAYTWTPGYPPPAMTDDEVHDRIDYVYAAGPATTRDSVVVGEDSTISDIVVEPWPSDHRAVVSELGVVPKPVAELDPLVATDSPVYYPGEPIEVDFLGAARGDRITVAKVGRSSVPVRVVPTQSEAGTVVVDDSAGIGRGRLLDPGEYAVNLHGHNGATASTTITVRDRAEQTTLNLDAETYSSGEPIAAAFTNASGNATDWVGFYRTGETPGTIASRFWQYVGGGQTPTEPVVDGTVTFSADTPGPGMDTWPPPPGDYVAYLFEEDGYRILAETTFSVTG